MPPAASPATAPASAGTRRRAVAERGDEQRQRTDADQRDQRQAGEAVGADKPRAPVGRRHDGELERDRGEREAGARRPASRSRAPAAACGRDRADSAETAVAASSAVTTNLNRKRTVAAAAAMSGRGPIGGGKDDGRDDDRQERRPRPARCRAKIAAGRQSAPSALMRSSVSISTPSEVPWRSPPGRDAAPP